MDWKDYMDDERAAKIAALAVDKDINHLLTPQKTIKTAAILGGMVGLDRFLLGGYEKGRCKTYRICSDSRNVHCDFLRYLHTHHRGVSSGNELLEQHR